MPVRPQQAVRHYETRQRQAIEAIGWFDELGERCGSELVTVKQAFEATLSELAAVYLPRLDQPSLDEAERLTGFRGFTRRTPLTALAHEEHVLRTAITRTESDPDYRNRERLVGTSGELSLQLGGARQELAPFEAECARYEDLAGFLDLIRVAYDTPEFEVQWWQPSYWIHWAAGDRICEALGMNDFGDDVLPAYLRVAERRESRRREVGRLEALVKGVHDLVRGHHQAVTRLADLPDVFLAECRGELAKHLAEADIPLLDTWLEADAEAHRGIRMALRKVAGLQAKRAALEEILSGGVLPQVQGLRGRLRKYSRKAEKYARTKYYGQTLRDSDLDLGFDKTYQKLDSRRAKIGKLVDRISRYDRYDRFRLDNDPDLWWYELTGSRPPSQLTRLRRWYDRNPDLRPMHEESADTGQASALARAAAASELDDLGYIS